MESSYTNVSAILEYLAIDDEYYMQQKGVNLSRILPLTDTETDIQIRAKSDDAYRRISDAVNKRSLIKYNLENYTDDQIEKLKKIACDYIEYSISTGNLFAYGGVNPDGTRMALVPEYIIDDLYSYGFIRVSFGRPKYE